MQAPALWKVDSTVRFPMNPMSARNPSSPGEDSRGEMTFFGYRRVPVQKKERYVRRHFDSIARKYDFMNTLLSCGFHYLWKRWAMKFIGVQRGAQVIDVCGGTADLSILAARATGPEGRIILYDINRAMMEAGKPKVLQ